MRPREGYKLTGEAECFFFARLLPNIEQIIAFGGRGYHSLTIPWTSAV